jgi:hypothetical protein
MNSNSISQELTAAIWKASDSWSSISSSFYDEKSKEFESTIWKPIISQLENSAKWLSDTENFIGLAENHLNATVPKVMWK